MVPAFNEQARIKQTLKEIKHQGFKNIVVIDDGSTDNTASVARSFKIPVVRHVLNRGLGAALGTGFDYAKTNKFDVLVTFDADGQHQAKDIKRLVAPILLGKADVVIGSRFKDFHKIPTSRKVANYISNFATFFICGVWTTDSQSGLRAFNAVAMRSIKIKTDRMEVSSEFFREIGTNKLKLVEIPIKALYTDYSLKSSKQGNIALSSVSIGIKLLIRLFR